ncbi:phosphoribosyl-AMP cyclohydrolase [Alphaproteobacteria bacterium]|nr:phosphoribosyl-AMP cyclohydrolase [Alphaproteobacteria bacterium]
MEKIKLSNIKYDKNGLVPVIVQDFKTHKVLMLAYSNKEAIELSLKKKTAHFWSRSREELWLKGATSGNYLKIINVLIDCDNDSLVYKVDLDNKQACHTGEESCFFKEIEDE